MITFRPYTKPMAELELTHRFPESVPSLSGNFLPSQSGNTCPSVLHTGQITPHVLSGVSQMGVCKRKPRYY